MAICYSCSHAKILTEFGSALWECIQICEILPHYHLLTVINTLMKAGDLDSNTQMIRVDNRYVNRALINEFINNAGMEVKNVVSRHVFIAPPPPSIKDNSSISVIYPLFSYVPKKAE